MKRFCCGDVVPGCTAVFEAPDRDRLMALIAQHAKDAHGLSEVPAALLPSIDAHTKDLPAA